ncbi:hypothetical protein BFG57_09080 [Bacillus solimangrovi]|uniref:Right handed beta helix domain-containing protein n=1 Tax=Bacillus solimangrovi TaxID=1305675 RepID=A0A1E5LJD7_9BACI|nr:hypothetical protein BFG57_09080 [Bacillus solimangrovi]
MTIRIVPTQFATVQDAITAANPGDSIQILAGVFDGFQVTKERLNIFGCGIGKTIIAGTPAQGSNSGIFVNANQTILQGMTVQGFSENGVLILTSHNILKHIESKFNMRHGFDGDVASNNNLILKCIATFNGISGFRFNDSEHNCLIDCQSKLNDSSGYQSEAPNNMFIACSSVENSTGFNISASHTLFNNVVNKEGGDGIRLFGSSNNIIQNKVSNSMENGVRVLNATSLHVIDSNIIRNNGVVSPANTAGIKVEALSSGSTIRFNKANGNIDVDIEAMAPANTNNTFDGNKCMNSIPITICNS